MIYLHLITTSVLLPVLAAVLGATLGALLYGGYLRRSFFLSECSKCDDHRLRKVLTKMQELAEGTAIQVGRHSEFVEKISGELSESSLAPGETDAITGIVERLLQANHQMQRQLDVVEARLQEQAEVIETQANEVKTDGLTGLLNRRAFDEALEEAFERYLNEKTVFSVTMVDVDHFKKFNDTHGHRVGDEVLKLVSKILSENMTEQEASFRYGGEEFSVIHNGADLDAAAGRADSLREAIAAAQLEHESEQLRVTASVGTAQCCREENMFGLLDRADLCLYASKEAGRNCTHYHNGREILRYWLEQPETAVKRAEPKAGPQEPSNASAKPSETPRPKTAAPQRTKQPEADSTQNRESKDRRDASKHDGKQRCAGKTPPQNAGEKAQPADRGPVKEPRRPATPRDGIPTAAKLMQRLTFENVPTLPNRTFFCSSLNKRLAAFRRGGPPLAVLFFEIDELHEMRQRHGEEAVRVVAQAVGQFLNATGRECDTVAQIGDGVFSMILHNVEETHAIATAERLRGTAAHCVLPAAGGLVQFTLSVGVVQSDSADNYKSILARAEQALLEAVRAGGNRCCFHNGQYAAPVEASKAETAKPTPSPSL